MNQDQSEGLIIDDFTGESNLPRNCERSSCPNKILPPGATRYPVGNHSGQTRWFCRACYDHFKSKPTAMLTTIVTNNCLPSIGLGNSSVNLHAIRQQTNMAQRNDASASRVQAIGSMNRQLDLYRSNPTASTYAAISRPHGLITNSAIPNIGIPQGGQIVNNIPSLANYSGPSGTFFQPRAFAGYTANHLDYNSRKANVAAIAYKPPHNKASKPAGNINNAITHVPVHAALHYEIKGKTKTMLIHTIHKGLSMIPAHIGTLELKQTIYEALMPMFYTFAGFTIQISELRLVYAPMHEILEDNPKLTDAIFSYFFVKNMKGENVYKVPRSGNNIGLPLLLIMSPEKWQEVDDLLRTNAVSISEWKPPTVTSMVTSLAHGTLFSVSAHPPSPIHDQDLLAIKVSEQPQQVNDLENICDTDQDGSNIIQSSTPPGPNRKRSLTMTAPLSPTSQSRSKKQAASSQWKSPDRAQLTQALTRPALTVSSMKDLDSSLTVEIFPIPPLAFEDLIKDHGHTNLLVDVGQGIIITNQSTLGSGTFKTCKLARLKVITQPNLQIQWSSDEQLVTKRYYKHIPNSSNPNKPTCLRLVGVSDLNFVVREANSLLWATSLMQMVYSFIASKSNHLADQVAIPNMRFVTAIIALSRTKDGGPEKAMIVEEYINPEQEGPFRKFITNANAIPIPSEGEPDFELAQFLSFVQHVQWDKTGGLAFISDFQGGDTLLTDPQIMTHPALEAQFGGGNVPHSFMKFPDDHNCNKYCLAFNLSKPEPYNPILQTRPEQTD